MTGAVRLGRLVVMALALALPGTGLPTAGAAAQDATPGAETLPVPPDGRPFLEYDESFKNWKLYCKVWPATRRVECELSTRGVNDRTARLVWLRSTERWLDGLRFRAEGDALEIGKPVRVWIDRGVFKPEFPCKPFPFETNTCAVNDPDTNRRLVERLFSGQEVSAVGQTPTGAKAEIRYPLAGFKAAVERSEQLRTLAGLPWMTAVPGGNTPGGG